MEKYLLSYLKDYYKDPKMDRILDYFKVDFDRYLYGYGRQFRPVINDKESELFLLYEEDYLKRSLYRFHRFCFNTAIDLYYPIRRSFCKIFHPYDRKKEIYDNLNAKYITSKKVLFFSGESSTLKNKFAEKGIDVVFINEYFKSTKSELRTLDKWKQDLYKLSFRERLQIERYDCLDKYIKIIQEEFRGYSGLFVGNDEYFECKLFVDAFKEMGIPTFHWSHGIPGPYDEDLYRRADYLMVWGKGFKDNFVKTGMDSDKIIVSGNIHYFEIPDNLKFRNSLDDVLVMTSVTIGDITHRWNYDKFPIWDRSLLITYIYSVENVLKSIGVKRARIRLHPVNNKAWVSKFIDTDFYEVDYSCLDESLNKATLVIGQTSSTFVEVMRKGITYIVYEPGSNGHNINNEKLDPPFDGSNPSLQVAFTEEKLKEMIETHYTPNPDVLKQYMVPFDISSIVPYLKK